MFREWVVGELITAGAPNDQAGWATTKQIEYCIYRIRVGGVAHSSWSVAVRGLHHNNRSSDQSGCRIHRKP